MPLTILYLPILYIRRLLAGHRRRRRRCGGSKGLQDRIGRRHRNLRRLVLDGDVEDLAVFL